MRTGVLGGTFDPVHLGHLVLAERAREGLRLDSVVFIPAGEPWRKSHRAITPGQHRLAMLTLAVEDHPDFAISDIELRRGGPTYTADTLAALAGERLDDEFWLIAGSDALADMPNWHDPERIVQHARLAVAQRAGDDVDARVDAALATLPGVTGRVDRFEMPRIDVSSTEVRSRVVAGRSIRYVVPAAVEAYIAQHRLYRG
jgi:nicotinate-nucleotide adenylyltransferase